MKCVLSIIGLVVLVVIVLGLLFGWPWVKSHDEAVRAELRGWTDGISSDAYQFARLQALLAKDRRQIAALRADHAENAARAAAAREEVQRLEREVEEQSRILRRADELLAENKGTYLISGRNYASRDVEADARVRARALKVIRTSLEGQQVIATERAAVVKQVEAAIAGAEDRVRAREAELEELQMRLANARLLQQARELARSINTGVLAEDTETEKAFAAARKRVRTAEALAAQAGAPLSRDLVVDWTGSSASEVDVRALIADALGREVQAPAPVVEHASHDN